MFYHLKKLLLKTAFESTQDFLDDIILPGKKSRWFLKPYYLLLVPALVMLVVPLFFFGQGILITANKFGTFIPSDKFLYFSSACLILYWLLYRLLHKFMLSNVLTWVHIAATCLLVVYFFATGRWVLKSSAENFIQASIMEVLMKGAIRELKLFSIKGILLIVSQLVLVVNLAAGLIKKKQSGERSIPAE
jgi:hypothetical protein